MRDLTRFAALLLLPLAAACAPAQDAAAPGPQIAPPAAAAAHAGATIELEGPSGKGSGYLALPKDPAGKHAALLVIQEWWGLNDWIKENADRFAAQGYVVLAVDLYRGKATSDPGVAHELMRGLPEDRGMADLEAGFGYLAARPDVDATRIGSVGWCMGGGYSLALAAHEPRLRAAVINYGRLITAKDTLAGIHASVLGNFAGEDQGIPPADVLEFEKAMKGAGKEVEIKIHEGKGHAFMNPNNKKGYDEPAARDAWARIDGFFARTLKNP
jgi:carboxymethylenebutenolidase